MKYGYARVSTDDQTPALQLAALKNAGCKSLFKDEGLSGTTTKRPALLRCLKRLRPGDVLIVWKLDRLGDKEASNIDAVIVATPDHMHATAAMWCMERGKHVYVQKPLVRTIWEARVSPTTSAAYKSRNVFGFSALRASKARSSEDRSLAARDSVRAHHPP